jgi:fibrillarin-like pre-rRNA processing protein
MRDLINNVAVHRRTFFRFWKMQDCPKNMHVPLRKVDTIYCDVAQPEQAKLLADNADVFLKSGGWVMITVKLKHRCYHDA